MSEQKETAARTNDIKFPTPWIFRDSPQCGCVEIRDANGRVLFLVVYGERVSATSLSLAKNIVECVNFCAALERLIPAATDKEILIADLAHSLAQFLADHGGEVSVGPHAAIGGAL